MKGDVVAIIYLEGCRVLNHVITTYIVCRQHDLLECCKGAAIVPYDRSLLVAKFPSTRNGADIV